MGSISDQVRSHTAEPKNKKYIKRSTKGRTLPHVPLNTFNEENLQKLLLLFIFHGMMGYITLNIIDDVVA